MNQHQVITLAPRPARSRLDLVGLGPAVLGCIGGDLMAEAVDLALVWLSRALAVDPECEVAGLATVVIGDGREVTGPDPGFRSIAARLRRGAYHQLTIT